MAGQYEDKPNTGVLFVKKIKNSDASPDFDGNFSVKVSDLDVVDGEKQEKVAEKIEDDDIPW